MLATIEWYDKTSVADEEACMVVILITIGTPADAINLSNLQ